MAVNGDFIHGYGAGKAAGLPQKVAEAVTDWLEENVDPDSGYVIDKSLTVENAAADAKKVGDEVGALKSAVNDPVTGLDSKAPAIIDTASGTIASFDDGADGMSIKALTVNIEPVQDLHGYEKPWPAGGGKNLINYLACTGVGPRDGTDSVYDTDTTSVDEDRLTIRQSYGDNGGVLKGVGTFSLQQGEYVTISFDIVPIQSDLSFVVGVGNYSGGGTSNIVGNQFPVNNKIICSVSASSNYDKTGVFVQPRIGTAVIKNLQVERGQVTSPTYSPYSNICPISGWTGANVYAGNEGASVYDGTIEQGGINSVGTETESNTRIRTDSFVKASGNIVLHTDSSISVDVGILAYKSDKTLIPESATAWVINTNNGISYSLPNNTAYIRVIYRDHNSPNGNILPSVISKVWVNDVRFIPISWQSEAGTVYGGTLDVTTGVLTVTMASLDLGTRTFVKQNTASSYRWRSQNFANAKPPSSDATLANIICEQYKTITAGETWGMTSGTGITIGANKDIYIYDTAYADAITLSGVQLVYELATPTVIQLDPVAVTTLLGTNNIWADCGPVSVDYPADTKLYINNKIAAAIAAALNA